MYWSTDYHAFSSFGHFSMLSVAKEQRNWDGLIMSSEQNRCKGLEINELKQRLHSQDQLFASAQEELSTIRTVLAKKLEQMQRKKWTLIMECHLNIYFGIKNYEK